MAHHKTKLTDKQKDAIVRSYIDGMTIPKLAKSYGVEYRTIQRIVIGRMTK